MSTSEPKSNVEWEQWAASDPLYGVASLEGRNLRGRNPWTEEQFLDHGVHSWRTEFPRWQRYGVDLRACVEIGCGAGRITRQLLGTFGTVYAIDISDKMLELASHNAPQANFLKTNGDSIPLADCSVGAAFSCDVFQHFESCHFVVRYLSEVYRVLWSGGTAMIHVPIYVFPRDCPSLPLSFIYRVWRAYYESRAALRRFAITKRLWRWSTPFMYAIQCEAGSLYSELQRLGFVDIEFIFYAHRSYIFVRKGKSS